MSKQSHTPGPWHVEKTRQGTAILDDAQFGRWTQIAMAYQANDVFGDGEKRIISHDEAKANAHLIAAAPEMLEALLMVRQETDDAEWITKLDRIIAKARGTNAATE